MNYNFITLITLTIILSSCKNEKSEKSKTVKTEEVETVTYTNKGHELVSKMIQKVGDYKDLRNKKDVVYTYVYKTPDGKTDISTEKYIFDGELSYGKYDQHERTLNNLTGTIEQGFDGENYWLKHEGKSITDTTALKRVAFNRPTNFYWFTMFQKLLDPGVTYDYIGEETIDDTPYDVVKVAFNFDNNTPTDIYQLYINKNTMLVDQFLFTVADFGAMETPNLMKLEYEDVDGMLIPTKRIYKKSTWKADVTDKPWISVSWNDIKFNNSLDKNDFKK